MRRKVLLLIVLFLSSFPVLGAVHDIILSQGDDLKAAIENAEEGAVITLNEGTYELNLTDGMTGAVKVSKSIAITSNSSAGMPVIKGRFELYDGAGLSISNVVIDGSANGSTDQIFLYKTANTSYGALDIQNCEVTGRSDGKGLIYLNVASEVEAVTFNNCIIHDIECVGGDFIDSRKALPKKINLTNSTFYNVAISRDFIRVDDASSSFSDEEWPIITVDHCTLYNVGSGGSKNRLLYVRYRLNNEITFTNNLVVGTNYKYGFSNQSLTTCFPTLNNNFYYNCQNLTSAEPDVAESIRFFDEKGIVLEESPFLNDSPDFTVNPQSPAYDNDAGDPRWSNGIKAYAVLSSDGETVTFYYDNQKESRGGVEFRNSEPYKNVAEAVFNSSFIDYNPTNTASWFSDCANLKTISGLSYLNTSEVNWMFGMFMGCSSLTNLDLSNFDTSKVENMQFMFYGCSSLTNLDISSFDTSKLESTLSMFDGCTSLESLDLSSFNTANVSDMTWMFLDCSSLKTIYVGEQWSLESVDPASATGNRMFDGCVNLVGGKGTVYNADYTDYTYAHVDGGTENPGYFTEKNVSTEPEAYAVLSSDGETVTFYYDNQKGSRGGIDMLTATSDQTYKSVISAIFDESFADYRPTSTAYWFSGCNNLTTISGLENLNTSQVTNMRNMFYYCSALTSLDVSGFITTNVTSMNSMFCGCSALTSLDVSNFNTANVTSMHGMFSRCSALTSLDVIGFETGNVTDMEHMFSGCSTLTDLDVSRFNTANVTSMSNMFHNCSSLVSLDLSGFNTTNVKKMDWMFAFCSALTSIYANTDKWSTAMVTSSDFMFNGCTSLVGGRGTAFDTSHTDAKYAHIDGGTENPGYFTDVNAMPADLDPITEETAVSTENLASEDLTDNVVDDVYYNVGTDGYDSTDGSIVISETTNMGQITDKEPGSDDVKQNFTGMILKVGAGKGTITVNAKTTGNAQLVVQVGNGTPMIASKTEQGDVVASYDVTEDTYVYIYAIIGSSSAPAHRAPSAGEVKIYGITVTPNATGISTVEHSPLTVDHYYTLDGKKLQGHPMQKGVYIVNGRKVVVK